MIRKTEILKMGKTQNNEMNNEKDVVNEQGEEHKIMWSMKSKSDKLTKGKNTK